MGGTEYMFPEAEKITLIQDNLSAHKKSALYGLFPPERARAILKKPEFVFTPKHGSWLNVAEIELSVLARQGLKGRIATKDELIRQCDQWCAMRNEKGGRCRLAVYFEGREDKTETPLPVNLMMQKHYTHQQIKLPEIVMQVRHFVLHKGECTACGKTGRGDVSDEFRTGFGPRFSALVGEIGGIDGGSRETVRKFIGSVLGVHISAGGVQKIIDRASAAVEPHYEAIRDAAGSGNIGHVDETTWKTGGRLHWLWVMANRGAAFFMIHPKRSIEAFEQLIGTWNGILISDGYGVYQKWIGKRQTCLAHLIRRADGLSERRDPELAACGRWAAAELRRLCRMAKHPPTKGEWSSFYARLCRLIALYRESGGDAGRFVRHIEHEMDSLFTFLTEEGVEPTNNPAERMIRFGVLWRKRSQGTNSDKGNRWVERILSLRQTCKLRGKSSFQILTDAVLCYFNGLKPDSEWIRQNA